MEHLLSDEEKPIAPVGRVPAEWWAGWLTTQPALSQRLAPDGFGAGENRGGLDYQLDE